MTFTIFMLIALVVIVAVLVLSKQADDERTEQQRKAYEFERDQYLRRVRRQYYSSAEPMGYRRANHMDFTGERELNAEELEQLKAEVTRS